MIKNLNRIEKLKQLGLTDSESLLYLAGLQCGSSSVADLVRLTNIKRPTAYYALRTLAEKGLVTELNRAKQNHFVMAPPSHLSHLLEAQRVALETRANGLEKLVDVLSSLPQEHGGAPPQVTAQHGIEGVRMIMDVAFDSASKHWDIIAPYHNFLRSHDKDYAERYLRVRHHRGITARTLWEGQYRAGGRKLTEREIQERNPRILPTVMHGKFTSMMIIFDDKVAVFTDEEEPSGILITSASIHSLLQAMFNGLWAVSEQY